MSQNYKEDFHDDDLNQILDTGGLLGEALNALKTLNAGAVEPTPSKGREPYQLWLDTSGTELVLKIRNTGDTGWSNWFVWDGSGAPVSSEQSALLAIMLG